MAWSGFASISKLWCFGRKVCGIDAFAQRIGHRHIAQAVERHRPYAVVVVVSDGKETCEAISSSKALNERLIAVC